MGLDGSHRNEERLGDFTVRFALSDQRSDLSLALAQPTEFLHGGLARRERGRSRHCCEGLFQEMLAQCVIGDSVCELLNKRSSGRELLLRTLAATYHTVSFSQIGVQAPQH